MSKLQAIRNAKFLSQSDLVKESGVSKSLITKYESGEKNINKAAGITLFRLAFVLKCSIEDLLENKEEVEKDVLFRQYCAWRKVSQAMLDDGMAGSLDCGVSAVREDFSNYAGLKEEISFEDMFELEKMYD